MKTKTSAASENPIERRVKYDKTLFGMWSMKMKKSASPRKRSSLRSRPVCRFGSAWAPPYSEACWLVRSDIDATRSTSDGCLIDIARPAIDAGRALFHSEPKTRWPSDGLRLGRTAVRHAREPHRHRR